MRNAIQPSLIAGEISPSIWGRTDLAKYKSGASTARNCFINYRGGAASRAGLAYVGTCKQPGTSLPPRDIPFQFNINQAYALELGDQYMRVKFQGAYVTESAIILTGVSSAGLFTTPSAHGLSVGDWVFDAGNSGFAGLTWIVNTTPTSTTFTVKDLFGNVISVSPATSGGTVSRIYTVVAPYAAADLPYLKFTQSANTMTLTCVNTVTQTEYPPYNLVRSGNTSWAFTVPVFAAAVAAPTNCTVVATASTTLSTWYSYVVTAVNSSGEESVASPPGTVENNDISVNAGSNTISWSAVSGATSYNVYKATPAYNVQVPVGVSYGYVGSAFGTQFTDTNIEADFTSVPPTHQNPFARGTILSVNMTGNGTGFTQSTATVTITTGTGTGFAATPIVVSGGIVAVYIANGGQNYLGTDTIVFGGGTGATATLTVGPQTGTYPATCAYFQQRLVYAASLNNPNTYWMSKPGTYNNFDSSIPVTANDSITGTPWAQQINGVQFLVPMPGGLITFTGNGAWQVSGGGSGLGSSQQSITPSNQFAVPQAAVGCSALIKPIPINYNILYTQAKGSIVRNLQYNIYANTYQGEDQTLLSNHLFTGYTIIQWAYAEEPYKIVWVVRNDGVLLSFTYIAEQQVSAWARHDTDGLVQGVCSITEPPVDAVYVIVKRFVSGQWMYYSERMNNRIWNGGPESTFCVDAGVTWPQPTPNATLNAVAAEGTSNITSVAVIVGGSNYTAPIITANDSSGGGSGATFTATLVSGVITAITPTAGGQNYVPGATSLIINDATGSGCIANPVITNNVVFNASASVFNSGMIGQVIRSGGGKAIITSFVSGTQVIANITFPISETIPNDPSNTPVQQAAGQWSVTPTTMTLSGLNHLNGMTVSILADGSVMPQQVVTNNSITLPSSYSSIIVGIPFTVQLQLLYLDVPDSGGDTVQGKRKNIQAVTIRYESSRGAQSGTNQIDASTLPNTLSVPWTYATGMREFKERSTLQYGGSAIPLITGDERILVPGDWAVQGQVAVQQLNPLPLNVSAIIPEFTVGDQGG